MVCRGRGVAEEPEQFVLRIRLASLSRRRGPLAEDEPGGEERGELRMRRRHPAVGMSL